MEKGKQQLVPREGDEVMLDLRCGCVGRARYVRLWRSSHSPSRKQFQCSDAGRPPRQPWLGNNDEASGAQATPRHLTEVRQGFLKVDFESCNGEFSTEFSATSSSSIDLVSKLFDSNLKLTPSQAEDTVLLSGYPHSKHEFHSTKGLMAVACELPA